jgi:hypothetical protein
MNLRTAAVFAPLLVLALSGTATSAEKWLTFFTAKGGYQFKGMRAGETWSFVVPGATIRTADDNGRSFADIDKVIVQVMTVPLSDFPKPDTLAKYRKYETDYLKEHGAALSVSNVCASMAIPHQEWKASNPGVSTSTYVTVATKKHILVLVVAFDKNASVMAADSKLRGICASLAV